MSTSPGPLGPSDSSDSPSDLGGIEDRANPSAPVDAEAERPATPPEALDADDATDRGGTGESRSAGHDAGVDMATDIAPDRIVDADEAGLGGGLDEAEEAEVDPVRPGSGDGKTPPR